MLLLATAVTAAFLGVPGPADPDPRVHSGRAGQTAVQPPRLAGAATIAWEQDEPMWGQAPELTGFSRLHPGAGAAQGVW